MVTNDDDLAEDLSEWFEESPEDRYQFVKDRLEVLTVEFITKNLRIEKDIFNAGPNIIKNKTLVVYFSLHEEH